jgi:hypothetical protein
MSLLIAFSKILEKIIYVRLHKLINNNGILFNEHYGFRRNMSTEAASCKLSNEVSQSPEVLHVKRRESPLLVKGGIMGKK